MEHAGRGIPALPLSEHGIKQNIEPDINRPPGATLSRQPTIHPNCNSPSTKVKFDSLQFFMDVSWQLLKALQDASPSVKLPCQNAYSAIP